MRDLSTGLDHLSLNTATVREQWSLAEIIEACVRHGIPGISPWRDQVRELGVEASARRLKDAGLRLSGYCRGGMFPAADEAGLRAAIEDNRRAIDEAAAIGAECLVVLAGGMPPGSKDLPLARNQARDGLEAILPHARDAGVPIAIEPLHPMYAADRCCINTLAHALDLCAELDSANEGDRSGPVDRVPGPDRPRPIGVAVDVYHLWWDPDLPAQIERAGRAGRILAFHVCDWLVPTRDLLLDRGMMGDGVIDIPGIRRMVEATGYAGLIEVEIFSRDWWTRDPDEVLSTVAERYRTVV